MPRIALVDASESIAIAVQSALGREDLLVATRETLPAGVTLVIAEADGRCADVWLGSQLPVLLLTDRDLPESAQLQVLKKPFRPAILRAIVRRMLEERSETAPQESPWLQAARIGTGPASLLAAAGRLGGTAWITGEPGTGTDEVAAALASAWDAGREPVAWQEGEALALATQRLDDPGRVLWAPALDERPLGEQRAFERFLAGEPARRVVATSGDDPERTIAAGAFCEQLASRLARLSLRLAPLRERRAEIAALATRLAAPVAARLFDVAQVTLSPAARRALETYPWPGNLVELEAVVTRSLAAVAPASSRTIELDDRDLRFAPDHLAPIAWDGSATPPSKRAVVVSLDDARTARPHEPEQLATTHDDAIESVLAGFAHDIRNPMATIKTFAGLEASRQTGDSAELARLAAAACERVDEQLEVLQRFSELAPGNPVDADLTEILGDAVDAAGASEEFTIAARRALRVRTDAAVARFVADVIVAECRSRLAVPGKESATADIAGGAALEIRIPTGGTAVDRLDKWVAGARLPWRLALARDAARRGGGDLEVEVEDGELRLMWRQTVGGQAPSERRPSDVGEEGKGNDDQAGSPDRRRRSRSS